jgi:glycosyltransferase involved in cell wall biosynthesis
MNRCGPLRATIASLLAQTWTDFELLIADDASEDETSQVVREFRDPRIQYLRHATRQGAYATWNAILRRATGRFVAVYHDHDYYAPDLVSKCAGVLASDPRIGFVHAAKILCDAAGRPRATVALPLPDRMAGVDFARYMATGFDQRISNFAMARTEVVRAAGLIDETLTLAADYDFWGRMALKSEVVAYLREPLIGQFGRDASSSLADYDRFAWVSTAESLRCRRALVERLAESSGRPLTGLRLRLAGSSEWFLSEMILQTVVHPERFDLAAAGLVVERHGRMLSRSVLWAAHKRHLVPLIRSASRLGRKLAKATFAWRRPSFIVPFREGEAPDWFPAPGPAQK